mmetsp:Transcript_6687/g.8749  ORF Transcript_6687/g.8749 Transcript_6687/m.8749 type:complete len:417 (+) Transcript_6687:335-1585(+)|eukprot:CAMPEP_0116063196 /NCGR_PEP_ID=MMETSP0322-20121206/8270_1 /TAXON_ID=163516 /ORGANISM="Leptocylindrus danicus var. apora, Strain B651" /LENGTH=416 /DNA_ID=CAMNT_0003548767 /DNA_START=347 /DNA_END=1597 /DNA_ORIENTATION=+
MKLLSFVTLSFLFIQAVYGSISSSMPNYPALSSSTNLLQEAKAASFTSSLTLEENVTSVNLRGGGAEGKMFLSPALLQNVKVLSYFALWYFLNVMYNIYNKKLMNVLSLPASIGTVQLLVGAVYSHMKWISKISKGPKLTSEGKLAVKRVGAYHGAGQMLSIVSMGAGPVSFTHIVKALEPFFSALVSALAFGKWMKPQVYATLIPVVGGVGYACLKETSFSWLQFNCAMGSNVAFALRAVMSKLAMTTPNIGENLGPANLFGVVTTYAFIYSIPAALLLEGKSLASMWNSALVEKTSTQLAIATIVSGLLHYLNNEVMYLALSNVHPVTLAVGNTMKRVFIIVASVIVFRNPISPKAAIGSAVGISGVLLYSLTKQYYEKLEAIEAEAARKKSPPRVRARAKTQVISRKSMSQRK